MEARPEITSRSAVPICEEDLDGFGRFPGEVLLIAIGDGLYAANNATTPDGSIVDGLACFRDSNDAAIYMEWDRGIFGSVVGSTFDNARELAKPKMKLNCLLLFAKCRIVDMHYIR